MKFLLLTAFLFFFSLSQAEGPAQDRYRSHQVLSGETVYSIAKKYGVSEASIYKLNPDARNGISSDSVLIIPSADVINAGSVQMEFKRHKVRRKETLFSISQKYGITVDDIKKYNKHLYSKPLKKGEKLQIPVFPKETGATTVSTSSNENANVVEDNTQIHIVQPKETKYGIARKYGISIAELEALNPDMESNFPIGGELKVPNTAVTESATIEEETFGFYEVLPKEGFYRLKVKLGLTQEEIVALNPYAKDGLKEGMILKIPKGAVVVPSEEVTKVNLEDSITDKGVKKIAVLLPFQLRKMDRDSMGANERLIKDNRAIRIALDFYSGALMAAEFAQENGISVQLNVYDTEGSPNKTQALISEQDFSQFDAVIGPLLSRNVERAASLLKRDNVPVFSPLSNRDIKLTSNLFQTLPSNEILEKAMINYLKEHREDRNLILISDDTRSDIKAKLLSELPGAITIAPREKGFLYVVDIEQKIDKTKENWVILESEDPIIISNVVGLLNGMPETHRVRMFTTNKNDSYDYDDISNVQLANLGFTFPSVSKGYLYNDKNAFLVSYRNKYEVLPNRFAVRGFDVMYDVLLRLAAEGNVYEASDEDFETEYIENKFRYQKKLFSGYTNSAHYILQYNKDLGFDIIK